MKRGDGSGTAIDAFPRSCLIRLIDFPDLPLRLNTQEIIKADRGTLLVRSVLPLRDTRVPVAYKRMRRVGWFKQVLDLLRPNRGLRSWRTGWELLKRGVATAQPLAVIVPRRHTFRQYTYVATEWLEGATQVDQFVAALEQCSPELRNQLTRAAALSLGRLIGQMHARGVAHRDLKVSNLMLRRNGNHVQAFVIDLDGVSLGTRVRWHTRWKNIARLAICFADSSTVTLSTRLRFLRAYHDTLSLPPETCKQSWRALQQVSRRLWKRKRQSRPPVPESLSVEPALSGSSRSPDDGSAQRAA